MEELSIESLPQPKGQPVIPAGHTWVQTERKAHEAWGMLCLTAPKAAATLHQLIALMGSGNTVVVSMPDLKDILGFSIRTLYRAVETLEDQNWIQRIKVSGNVYGFAVNSEVVWAGFRGAKYDGGVFNANIVAPKADILKSRRELRRVPLIFPPERALPAETGGNSGQQTELLPSSVEITPDRRINI